jgi:hypothetical protein
MGIKKYTERIAKPGGWAGGKTCLSLAIVLATGLALSCSSRSSSVPAPPTPPAPPSPPAAPQTPPTQPTPPTPPATPTSSAPTTSTASSGASGSETVSPASAEETAASGAPGERERESSNAGGGAPSKTEISSSDGTPAGSASDGARTTEERTGDLDRKLDDSLTEFDGMLLKEQELLDERREASGGQSMGGGYGATGEEAPGSEMAAGRQTGGQDQEYSAQGGVSGGSPDTPQGEPSESAPGESMGDQGQTDRGRIPPDVGDGSDDDIVARQLREAAEKEDDPELREKLWDEYRAYKKGTKKN